mgnify:CR=1 FL=1
MELVEDEEQRAEHHDEELHRDLEHGVEHQAEPALAEGGAELVAVRAAEAVEERGRFRVARAEGDLRLGLGRQVADDEADPPGAGNGPIFRNSLPS